MKGLVGKFQNKEFVQNVFVEIVGDIVMIVFGLILGYLFKTYIM